MEESFEADVNTREGDLLADGTVPPATDRLEAAPFWNNVCCPGKQLFACLLVWCSTKSFLETPEPPSPGLFWFNADTEYASANEGGRFTLLALMLLLAMLPTLLPGKIIPWL